MRPYVFRDARFWATAGQSLLKANNPAAFPLLGSLVGSRRSAILDGASALKGAPTANGASVLLDKNDCKGFEKFAKQQSPTEIEKGQDGLGYVRWRGTVDVFRYLGSVLRKNRMKAPVAW